MNRRVLAVLAALLAAGPVVVDGAACDPSWLPTFGGLPGVNGTIHALAGYDDGSGGGPALYAGGEFTTAGGVTANRIAKWDGTWSTLGSGMNNTVRALSVYDDGTGGGPALYAAGNFTTAGGVTANSIAKWDGTSWSALGTGMNNLVYGLTVFDDGSGGGPALYAGGEFTTAGGVAANRIAKWDGTSWSALGSGVTGGGTTAVVALIVFDDGGGGGEALYAGGNFTTAGGVTARQVARWDGASWSALGSGLWSGPITNWVRALTAFDDGSGGGPALYAGGEFTTAGGVPANYMAKWTGTTWSALGTGMSSSVWALTAFDDDSGGGPALYAGGVFATAGGVTVNRIARWDGTSWSALGSGMSNPVRALSVHDDGSGGGPALYAGGEFGTAGGGAVYRIAKWNGTAWAAVVTGVNGNVSDLTAFDDGGGGGEALYAGGSFTTAGGVNANFIAKWDGTTWSALGTGMNGSVFALTVHDDGSGGGPALYAGGGFSTAGGVTANYIAKWDGTSWSALGTGMNSSLVWALTAFDDGSGGGEALYAGGSFSTAGGAPASRIAKWDGTSWSALSTGMNASVQALTVHDDGSGGGPALYAGGEFTTAGGVTVNRIAKWNGTSWSALGSGMSGGTSPAVRALTVFDDGGGPALYAGGEFTAAGGVTANRIAKWNGTTWSALGSGMNTSVVASLTVFDDGSGGGEALYAGGGFSTAGGVTVNRIAKWDGTTWSALGSGMNNGVSGLTVFDDGSGGGPALYAGGDFTNAIDSGDSYLARWGCEAPPCPWDCDGNDDGIVSVTDLLALLGQYDPQSPVNCAGGSCDYNADGCVDIVDLLELLAHYDPAGLGCP